MNIESSLAFFKWVLYVGMALVAIGTIGVNILSSKVDKKKDHKIDELLKGNATLLKNTEQYQKDLIEKDTMIQELERGQKNLQKLTAPRSISLEQRKKIIDLLSSHKPEFQIILACRLLDEESLNYAETIAETFRKANWQVGPTNKSFLDNIESDVAIAITDDKQKGLADEIAKILNAVGIKCKLEKIRQESISGVQDNTIYLIVGSKLKK
jgi:hypothetical protein